MKKKNFPSSQWVHLTKGLSRHVPLNIKLVYVSIIHEKISSFPRAFIEIFNFYFGCVTYGPPCIGLLRMECCSQLIRWDKVQNYQSLQQEIKRAIRLVPATEVASSIDSWSRRILQV